MKNFLALAAAILLIVVMIPATTAIAADGTQPQCYALCGPDCDCYNCPNAEQCQWYRLGGETWSAVTPVRLVSTTARPTTYTTGGASANTPGWQYTSGQAYVSYPAVLVPIPTYRPVYHYVNTAPLAVGVPTTSGYFYVERKLGLLGLRGKVVQCHRYGP